MDPQAQRELSEIRALIREGAARAAENHRQAMARMDRAEARADRADARMDRFDRQLQATRKLVEAGIKMVGRLAADTRELKKSQKAFLDSFRNGRNGHHRN